MHNRRRSCCTARVRARRARSKLLHFIISLYTRVSIDVHAHLYVYTHVRLSFWCGYFKVIAVYACVCVCVNGKTKLKNNTNINPMKRKTQPYGRLHARITSYLKLVQMVRRARLHVVSRRDFRFFTAPGDLTAFVRRPVISLSTLPPPLCARVIIIVGRSCARASPCNTRRLIRDACSLGLLTFTDRTRTGFRTPWSKVPSGIPPTVWPSPGIKPIKLVDDADFFIR